MGCFLACFKGPKDRRRRRSKKKSFPLDHRVKDSCKLLQPSPSPKQLAPDPCACATHLSPESGVESNKPLLPSSSPKQITPQFGTPDQLSPAAEVTAVALPELKENVEQDSHKATRKKVTFDLNVKTYEDVRVDDDPNCSSGDDEGAEEIEEERNQNEHEPSPKSRAFPFPLNHRYQNCESSDEDGGSECGEDDEDDDDECDSDFDEDDEDEIGIEGNEDESYDSFFSLPIDEEPKVLQEVNSPKPKSAFCHATDRHPIVVSGGSVRDRSQFVHPVLNPVENLSQWKEVKVRAAPAKNPKKENPCSDQENRMGFVPEPAIMVKKTPQRSICSAKQEISVDASLSNWLPPSSDNSTVDGPQASNSRRSNSPFSREERPILGALTIEDIKQSSVTSSPRRSPSKSPPADEIPILGTVGRYWNSGTLEDDSASSRRSGSDVKGIPNTTSKYREDRTVNWHSTPFEVRLEKALEHGAA